MAFYARNVYIKMKGVERNEVDIEEDERQKEGKRKEKERKKES